MQAENIALHGTSAGAGAALWLGFSSEMAQPEAEDPVLRMSSRVTAVAANDVQGSYDFQQWEDVIFTEYNVKLAFFLNSPLAGEFLDFYGLNNAESFYTEPYKDYRQRVDLLTLMDAEDAPFRVSNQLTPLKPPGSTFALLHHAYHGRALHEQAKRVGLSHDVYLPALDITGEYATSADFLIQALKPNL